QAASGMPPLIEGESSAQIRLSDGLQAPSPDGALVGGMAIDLALRTRSRLNGLLVNRGVHSVFRAEETFANCRKYVAPSVALESALHVGPSSRLEVAMDDAGLHQAISAAET